MAKVKRSKHSQRTVPQQRQSAETPLEHVSVVVNSSPSGVDAVARAQNSAPAFVTETVDIKDGQLHFVDGFPDTPPHTGSWDGKVGFALLTTEQVGHYTAAFGLEEEYRGRAIITATLKKLINQAIESDKHFEKVEFVFGEREIDAAGIAVAQNLGAILLRNEAGLQYYELTAEAFQGSSDD